MNNHTDSTPRRIERPHDDGSGYSFTAERLLYVLDGFSAAANWKPKVTMQPEDGVVVLEEETFEVPPVPENTLEDQRAAEEQELIAETEQMKSAAAAKREAARRKEEPVRAWIQGHITDANPEGKRTLAEWRADLTALEADAQSWSAANIVLGIALLRHLNRSASASAPSPTPSSAISLMWGLVHAGLTRGGLDMMPNRSAQGFVAVPLFSRVHNQDISELVRFHIWRSDGNRGNPDITVHSHQPWTRSWVLGGKGVDHSYTIERLDKGSPEMARANCAYYSLEWRGDAKDNPTAQYVTNQASSTIFEKDDPAECRETHIETHTRDMSYVIPAEAYHQTEVAPEEVHATLFFFDASYGFVTDAGVIGPLNGETFTTERVTKGVKTMDLALLADALRRFDFLMDEARQYAGRGHWDLAMGAVEDAIKLCSSRTSALAKEPHYLPQALAEVQNIAQRFGRYDDALSFLQRLLHDAEEIVGLEPEKPKVEELPQDPVSGWPSSDLLRAEIHHRLGSIYRHLQRLDDARREFEVEYTLAKELHWKRGIARTLANLGIVNHQRWRVESKSEKTLDKAIEQLQDAVARVRAVKNGNGTQSIDRKTLSAWEAAWLAWLSLCHAERGSASRAVEAIRDSFECTQGSKDRSAIAQVTRETKDLKVLALCRFFHGQALQVLGQEKTRTSIVKLFEHSSDELRAYIDKLADFGVVDAQGNNALDYAISSGDGEWERLIINGLEASTLPADQIERRRKEAAIRKDTRTLWQETLRPGLLEHKGRDALGRLRDTYASAKREVFDGFKYVPYSVFKQCGRIPRSGEGQTRRYQRDATGGGEIDFVLFLSYVWNHKRAGTPLPDDEHHSQYGRMLGAIDAFLKAVDPPVNPETLGIWVDYACIDQESPTAGVNALPLSLMQCNAVISLVDPDDESYYSRAWCAAEVIMTKALRKAWGFHSWYVYDARGTLSEGPYDRQLDLQGKGLTYEEDRPRVTFLTRQCDVLAETL